MICGVLTNRTIVSMLGDPVNPIVLEASMAPKPTASASEVLSFDSIAMLKRTVAGISITRQSAVVTDQRIQQADANH